MWGAERGPPTFRDSGRAARWIFVVLACVSCTERALEIPEAWDASSPDLARCSTYAYALQPISSVVPLDGSATFVPSAAVRLLVTYDLLPCAVPADVVASSASQGSSTVISVGAYAWVRDGFCDSPPSTVVRELTLSASDGQGGMRFSSLQIVVRDDATPSPQPLLTLTAAGAWSAACTPTSEGETCITDCDCFSPAFSIALCLVGADGSRRCGLNCHEDSECRLDPAGPSCSGPPEYRCGAEQRCRSDSECPFGEHVDNCVCTPANNVFVPACGCDTDCPSGMICTDGSCATVCTGPQTCWVHGFDQDAYDCAQGQCTSMLN